MKIPRELEINGNIWRVRFVKHPGGEICDGMAMADERLIDIRTNMSMEERWATFVHEVIHAIEFEYGEQLPSLRRLLTHKLIARIEFPIAKMILDTFSYQFK